MLQTLPTATQQTLTVILPYVQLFGVASVLFGVAWWLRSAQSEVIQRLDIIEGNHLHTIEENTGKTTQAIEKQTDLMRDEFTELRQLLSAALLLKKDE